MSTLDLLDDSFPHGTPDGYRRGCRTAACPALIPCRTVHTRYAGDFSFAKLIDAGTPRGGLDLGGQSRALDGDGDGVAVPDIGAVERPRP